MEIPSFEYNKDSYIIKNKIKYDTSCENNDYYGILFTDYNIARKSQTKNAELFDDISISLDINNINTIELKYYKESHNVNVSDGWSNTELVMSGDTIESGATFIYNNDYDEYYIPSGFTSLFIEGDLFNIYFHVISNVSGTTTWEHTGPSGDTWVAYGYTENGIPYQTTGTTTINGYSTGTTTWEVVDYKPILKYKAKILSIGNDYIRFEKKIEYYLYNNLMKIAKDYDYTSLYYTLESLNFSDTSYPGIKYIFEETKWGKYFSFNSTENNLEIKPIKNNEDIYFDYDNVEIIINDNNGLAFNTNCLYNKYKLQPFLEQFGYSGSTSVYYDNIVSVSGEYQSGNTLNIILDDINDAQYFIPYTYLYVLISGWYLPSFDELREIYNEIRSYDLGDFDDNNYWSSSQHLINYAFGVDFTDGNGFIGTKESHRRIRPIMDFISTTHYPIRHHFVGLGWVFHRNGDKHYVVAEKPSENEITKEWGLTTDDITTSEDIDTGKQNTQNIVDFYSGSTTDYAADYCYNYNSNILGLITDIEDDIISILTPNWIDDFGVKNIQNLNTIEDISKILYEIYINVNNMYINSYRKLTEQQRKKVYASYAYIFDKLSVNVGIRNKITGIIFENYKNVFTFKIYKPDNIEDKRLMYAPTEIVKIGTNNKTTIPVRIKQNNN